MMSAIATKRTWRFALHMSAFGGKADITTEPALMSSADFQIGELVPVPDIARLYFGSLSARISSLWISGALANRSPALAFSIKAAAT